VIALFGRVLHLECRWRVSGGGNAAARLGLHPNTLRYRMEKLGIACRHRRQKSPPG
jgi:transcriptional regulator with GAF, ATPase, and Fis domain